MNQETEIDLISFKLECEAQIHPTETEEKVKAAITNIFPTIEIQVNNDWIISHTSNYSDLFHFTELLEKQRVLDAARRLIFKRLVDDTTRFLLNKQAAYMGKVNICENESESPMGPIFVVITSNRIIDLLNQISPKWEWLKDKRKGQNGLEQ